MTPDRLGRTTSPQATEADELAPAGPRLAWPAVTLNRGTEHGYGNLMMVLGGSVIGGLHGTWPGLAPGQLVDGTDLAVTTDYRRVLSEISIRRLCNSDLETIFPGYTGYTPLGIVEGTDTPTSPVFGDGFESGDLSAWSTSTG